MCFHFYFLIFFVYFCIGPIYAASVLHRRQNNSKTVIAVQVINTPQGPMTQTCVITLTPITDNSGKPAVQEIQHCDLTPGVLQTSSLPASSSPIPTPPSLPSPTFPLSSALPTVTETLSTSDIPTNTDTATTTATGLPPSSTSDTASQASSSAESKFQIPGKNLSVLPIGLGVIGGVLVIALIVVGLVTYERTKYRKAFRQRKLAEIGADMGYSDEGN